jgi:adhesin transport system outer membrane protein
MTEQIKSPWKLLSIGLIMGLTAVFVLAYEVPAQAQGNMVTPADTVITALEYSPRLQVLQHNQQAIIHEHDRAIGGYYPKVDLTFGYGAESHSDWNTRDADIEHNFYDRLEASLRLSQLVYDGKETSSIVGIEKAKLDSAGIRTFDNAEAIALDAIIAHLEVYRQRELVGLAKRNIYDHQEILDMLKERQEGGAGSIADVDQTQARLARTFASLAETQAGLKTAEANYMRFVGKLAGDMEFYNTPKDMAPQSLEEAITATLDNNPKIMALSANVVEADQRVELSRSSFLPKVHAELSTSYEDQVESSETYEHNNQAMLRLRWNLYNGGADIADRKAASARKMQAASHRDDQRDIVVEETRATWAELESARKQVVSYGDSVNYNQKTLDSYMKQFDVGQRTLLDVLDARNELFQSSGLMVTARTNEVIAVGRLLALAGQLTESLQVDKAVYMVNVED